MDGTLNNSTEYLIAGQVNHDRQSSGSKILTLQMKFPHFGSDALLAANHQVSQGRRKQDLAAIRTR